MSYPVSISLEDIHPLYGGVNLFIHSTGRAILQSVRASHERRYEFAFPPAGIGELEILVAKSGLAKLEFPLRPGLPDEACPVIRITWSNGESTAIRKWANDKSAPFDAVYTHLKQMAAQATQGALVYEGAYVWDLRPDWTTPSPQPPATEPPPPATEPPPPATEPRP